jgi:hypothetical protein
MYGDHFYSTSTPCYKYRGYCTLLVRYYVFVLESLVVNYGHTRTNVLNKIFMHYSCSSALDRMKISERFRKCSSPDNEIV